MAQDSQELIVHGMGSIYQMGPVFYTAMPCADQTLKGCYTNGWGDKTRLVSTLWDHVAVLERPLRNRYQPPNSAAFPIRVVCGLLGKPHLMVGDNRGPAISFSTGGGNIWAALCGDESDIGIDVAGADEFQGDYPFHRVFNQQELQHALMVSGGDLEKASALLWSIKEAVVKALGCAFHLVDPRHITVYPSAGGEGGYTFPVGLSENALARFPRAARQSLWVRSLPQDRAWLSIALVHPGPTGHG